MESIQRGFAFFKQSWQMALADHDLIKPSILAMIAGFLVTLVMLVPMGITGLVLGDSRIGQGLLGILGLVLVFLQYMVGYIFSAMTIELIYAFLTEGDGRMDKAWNVVRRDFWDIASLAAVSLLVHMLKSFLEGRRGGRGGNAIFGALAGWLAATLGVLWSETTFLVLPVMVIEDVSLKDGLQRVFKIVKDNLLLVGVSTVGVGFVTGLIGFLLGATGIALGIGVGLGIVSISGGATIGIVSGVSLGVLIASVFIIIATLIGTYTTTAYHTCLYLWARNVESARQGSGGISGQLGQPVPAPAPLAAVL